MTLQELKYSYILYVLVKNDYVKLKTAKELGISIRGLRDTLKQMKAKGYIIPEKVSSETEEGYVADLSVSNHIMPTNKERIAYKDWLLNADYMRSMTKRSFSL